MPQSGEAEVTPPPRPQENPVRKTYRRTSSLRKEKNRLRTFETWPLEFIDPKELAKDGFFYAKTGDVCSCVFCYINIGFWTPGDDIAENHQSASPDCPLVLGLQCGNVPISETETESDSEPESESEPESDADSESTPEMEEDVDGYDVCGPYGLEIRPFSGPERPGKNSPPLTNDSDVWKHIEQLGVSKVKGPVSLQYATYESRLETYDGWKYHEIQTPEKLAQAGFYHISRGDQVLCFYCGAGLHKWKAHDDPWREHARHSYKCGFVILHKGHKFIHEAFEKRKVVLTQSEVKNIVSNSDQTQSGREGNGSHEEVKNPPTQPSGDLPTEPEEKTKEAPETDIKLCRICYIRDREIVFLPCGHFISCGFCASSLGSCALCRTALEAVIRTEWEKTSTEGVSEICIVCKKAQREVVFLPCNHFISCFECSMPTSTCALCNKNYKLKVRTYLS